MTFYINLSLSRRNACGKHFLGRKNECVMKARHLVLKMRQICERARPQSNIKYKHLCFQKQKHIYKHQSRYFACCPQPANARGVLSLYGHT